MCPLHYSHFYMSHDVLLRFLTHKIQGGSLSFQ